MLSARRSASSNISRFDVRAFLEVKELHKKLGGNMILKGIDLTAERGEAVCVIGSSGGGKTTLMRCLNLL